MEAPAEVYRSQVEVQVQAFRLLVTELGHLRRSLEMEPVVLYRSLEAALVRAYKLLAMELALRSK